MVRKQLFLLVDSTLDSSPAPDEATGSIWVVERDKLGALVILQFSQSCSGPKPGGSSLSELWSFLQDSSCKAKQGCFLSERRRRTPLCALTLRHHLLLQKHQSMILWFWLAWVMCQAQISPLHTGRLCWNTSMNQPWSLSPLPTPLAVSSKGTQAALDYFIFPLYFIYFIIPL